MNVPIFVLSFGLAGLFPSPAFAALNIDYVSVGNSGNISDTTGYGAVAYDYQIGKYEVTNTQYTAFLNAVDPGGVNPNGIYNAAMGGHPRGGIAFTLGAANRVKYAVRGSMGNKPVNFVSWYDAARFVNWVHNGQGEGDTDTGAYTLSENTGIIIKNVEATVWLPSEDEWYKAAYFDPRTGASGDNYWLYPTQSDTMPSPAIANPVGGVLNPGANVANYLLGADWRNLNGNVTTVGSAGANNYFGTADQGGNVYEWNDAVISGQLRGMRGGAWISVPGELDASGRADSDPATEVDFIGFRVAAVPEPASFFLTMLAGIAMLNQRRR